MSATGSIRQRLKRTSEPSRGSVGSNRLKWKKRLQRHLLFRLLENESHVGFIFHFEERPFLSKVEYSGSRLLSQKQIEKMRQDKKLTPRLESQPIQPRFNASPLRFGWG